MPPARPHGCSPSCAVHYCSSVLAVLLLLASGPASAVDPQLEEVKDVGEDDITTLLLVNRDYYVNPDEVQINIQCYPSKGDLSPGPDSLNLNFEPYDLAEGQDFFTFNVTGELIPGLTAEEISDLQSTKVVRLNILKTNDPPKVPVNNEIELSVSPGTETPGKMRRGCYNGGTLNNNLECIDEFPNNPDTVLPMSQDMDRDELRFIVVELPTKGTYSGGMDTKTGDFTYTPFPGVNREWDSFKYYITDCPSGCTPANGCPNKDPPGCAITSNVTVTILIGNPTGMRAKGKSYKILEDTVLQNDANAVPPVVAELERATYDEAGISDADAAVIQLNWRIIQPPEHGQVFILGCNASTTETCQQQFIPFVYVPNPNFFGSDTFTYRVEDRGNPHPNNDLDGSVLIDVIGLPDPPVARSEDITLEMALLEQTETQNYHVITLEVIEYDRTAKEMWMAMTSEIGNGTLYSSAAFDDAGNLIEFGSEMVRGRQYNMSLAKEQDVRDGKVYEMILYYIPPQITRGLPLDAIRWLAMSGAGRATACTNTAGFVTLPDGGCTAANQIANVSMATTRISVQCAKGYSVRASDPTKCSRCGDGNYAPGFDLPSCTPCERGRYSNSATGHAECVRCPRNSYADQPGMSDCIPCPSNLDDPFDKTSITDGPGKTSLFDCVCERKNTTVNNPLDRGYYGPAGGSCRPCPETGSRCMNNNMTWPVNTEGFYLDLDFDSGLAIPLPCNHRAACPAHEDFRIMRWKPCADGYNNTRCADCWNRCDENTPDGAFRCFPEGSPAYQWWNPVRDQWYRFDTECRECPKLNMLAMLLGALFGVVLLAPIIFKISDAVKNMPSINISISFAQILAVFPRFNIAWPVSMLWLWEKLSFFNFNVQLLAPECVMSWKWIYTYFLTVSTPVILLTLLVLVVVFRFLHTLVTRTLGASLKKRFPKRECLSHNHMCNYYAPCDECQQRPAHERPHPGLIGPPCGQGLRFWLSKKRYQLGMFLTKGAKKEQYVEMIKAEVRVYLVFLKIGYIFLASAAFSYFDCVGNDEVGGGLYLDADPALECYNWDLNETQDQTWPRFFPLAVFVLLLYPVGIFVLFASLLYYIRKALDNKAAKHVLGALYARYKPQFFFWELIMLGRKLVIVLCALIFSSETSVNGLRQLLFGMLALLIALLAHMYAYPFDRKNLNHLESSTIAAQFFSLFVGLAFLSNKMSYGFSKFMEICNLLVLGFSFFACFYYIILVDLFPDFRTKWNEHWEKRRDAKRRRERAKQRKKNAKEGKNELSIGGFQKVMEFRWRASLGPKASKLLTVTGARILVEFIENSKSLDEIINEGRPDDKRLELPTNDKGEPLTKKEAVKQCFEALADFIDDEDNVQINKSERQYIYESFRPNVRNVIMEGLSREDKETADRLKSFLRMVIDLDPDKVEPSVQRGGKSLFTGLNRRLKGKQATEDEANKDGDQKLDVGSSDDDDAPRPADAKPLLSLMKSQANN